MPTTQLVFGIATGQQPITGLSAGGRTVMIASISLVTALSVFCLYRILREQAPSNHHHSPLDIDTDKLD